jgi:uncharacterized YccA/Bax inhibitor family protein
MNDLPFQKIVVALVVSVVSVFLVALVVSVFLGGANKIRNGHTEYARDMW